MIHYLSKTSPKKLSGIAILRLDFNTEDTWRLEASIPTLKLLQKSARAVVVLSHRGRPNGADQKFSLAKDAAVLSEFLKKDVIFVPHFNFTEIGEAVRQAPKGSVFLLENMRFLPGEAKNDEKLGRELASLGDYFVNDAFAVSHRKAASLVAITKHMPAYAGLTLEREIKNLSVILRKPSRPFIIVVGGAKTPEKLGVLQNFKKKADAFLLGGAPANTMLELRGHDVGSSLIDVDPVDIKELKEFVASNKVIVPADWRVVGDRILDIGTKTEKEYARIISHAGTVLWAGPLGVTGKKKFSGSLAVARAITKNKRAFSVTGGGETVMLLKKYKLDKKFSFVSTGGGAMLEFLAGKKLPGIEALR